MHVSRAYAARVAQRLFLRQDMRHLILTQKGRLFFKGIDHRLHALRIHLVKKLDLLCEHVELTLEVFHLIVIHVQHDAGCETLKISLVKLFHHFLLISAS